MIRECPFCHIKVMLNESNYCPSCHNNVDFDTAIVDEFVSVELKPDMKLPNICIMCGDTANIRKKIKMKKSNSNSRFIRMITFAVLELALISGVIYNVRIKLVEFLSLASMIPLFILALPLALLLGVLIIIVLLTSVNSSKRNNTTVAMKLPVCKFCKDNVNKPNHINFDTKSMTLIVNKKFKSSLKK